jgi:nitrate/TMAO reductase-like tetraheme cytochrome c subunit
MNSSLRKAIASLSPVLYLSSNWLSRIGVVLVTSAVVLEAVLFPLTLRIGEHPYLGMITFLALPGLFFGGLILIPVGIILRRRKRQDEHTYPAEFPPLDLQNPELRRTVAFIGITTVANLILGALFFYAGINYMDSVSFCGTTCHTVMQPEYVAYQRSPHARVECVQCHIGRGASWFVRYKISGSYQVLAVIFSLYPRPIPAPISNLRPARETCEQCHWPERFSGDKLEVKTKFGDDEKNTITKTVLLMHIGGRNPENKLIGIHGRHLVLVTYIPTDEKRQVIPWVSYRNADGSTTEYVSRDVPRSSELLARGQRRTMDCMDCHNRPSHRFEMPESAVNQAMAAGLISPSLPFAHKFSLELLKRNYPTRQAAQTEVAEAVREYYRKTYFGVYNTQRAQVEQAAATLASVYNDNIFPAMNVSWGMYPNNLGHNDFPGCFRCHDGNHQVKDGQAKGGQAISQDCNTCHSLLAMDESNPKILDALYGK